MPRVKGTGACVRRLKGRMKPHEANVCFFWHEYCVLSSRKRLRRHDDEKVSAQADWTR